MIKLNHSAKNFHYGNNQLIMIDSFFVLRVPAILFCLTIHEFAHGWMANRLGDHTAAYSGRLTLNPLSHLDVFGTLMLLFGPFGWAKPVPVNPYNLRNPKKDLILVSAAGPVINILAAIFIGLIIRLLGIFPYMPFAMEIGKFLIITMMINLGLAFFNLIPIPPLDGSNILMGFLRPDQTAKYREIMSKAPMVFMGLIMAEWLFHIPLLTTILNPLWTPFKNFFQFLVFQRIYF